MNAPATDHAARKRRARSAARLGAVQALYQMEMTGTGVAKVRSEFETHRFGMEIEGEALADADVSHFRKLLQGVVERQAELDQTINATLKDGWPLKRIDPILRALFRAGGYEMLAMDNVPPKVVISEYVEVAKAFFDGDEPRLANGVLDAMARRRGLLGETAR